MVKRSWARRWKGLLADHCQEKLSQASTLEHYTTNVMSRWTLTPQTWCWDDWQRGGTNKLQVCIQCYWCPESAKLGDSKWAWASKKETERWKESKNRKKKKHKNLKAKLGSLRSDHPFVQSHPGKKHVESQDPHFHIKTNFSALTMATQSSKCDASCVIWMQAQRIQHL